MNTNSLENQNADINKSEKHGHKKSPYGTWKCRICGIIFDSKHHLYDHYHAMHPDAVNRHNRIPWNKGLTANTSEIIRNGVNKLLERYKNKELTPSMLGKHHTIETRQKLSKIQLGNDFQRKTKRRSRILKKMVVLLI